MSAITLGVGGTVVTLHPDLYWSDEHDWHPVEQTAQRTITGALVVSTHQRTGGRPITLQPIDEASAWMPRSTVEQLRNWASVAGQEMTLTLRGIARDVIFRHHEGAGLEAVPIVHFDEPEATDWYRVTLRLMEV